MATVLGVGLIGCGRVAQAIHLPILARLPGVRLAALAEPDAVRRAAAVRQAPAALAVDDYHALLARSEIAAVVICLPPAAHAVAATAAFAQGKHIYLEKPLATDLNDAGGVLNGWRAAGTVGMIGFNYRFNPLYAAARQAVRDGWIGEVVAVRTVFSAAMADLPDWKQRRVTGGGALLDLASHHLDLIPWLIDQPVAAVTAAVRSQRSEVDSAIIDLHMAGGVFAQVFCSLCSVDEDRVEIYGRAGKLSVDRYRDHAPRFTPPTSQSLPRRALDTGRRALVGLPYTATKLRSPGHEPSYRLALAAFARAARDGRSVTPDLDDGYRSLAALAAAEASAQSARTVTVPTDAVGEARPAVGVARSGG